MSEMLWLPHCAARTRLVSLLALLVCEMSLEGRSVTKKNQLELEDLTSKGHRQTN